MSNCMQYYTINRDYLINYLIILVICLCNVNILIMFKLVVTLQLTVTTTSNLSRLFSSHAHIFL